MRSYNIKHNTAILMTGAFGATANIATDKCKFLIQELPGETRCQLKRADTQD